MSEWLAYYQLEPFGEDRADYRAGIVAATTANVWRGKKGKPLDPSDFLPDFAAEPKREQSPEEQSLALRRVALLFGGRK